MPRDDEANPASFQSEAERGCPREEGLDIRVPSLKQALGWGVEEKGAGLYTR